MFVDLTNAFPTVDRPTLWVTMRRMGISGPTFDWVWMLYKRMSYAVRMDGSYSETSTSDLGVLTGDPAAPFNFLIFFLTFTTPSDRDDVILDGRPISHLEQADDLTLLSTTIAGAMRKLALL